jgi:hypothetical protein
MIHKKCNEAFAGPAVAFLNNIWLSVATSERWKDGSTMGTCVIVEPLFRYPSICRAIFDYVPNCRAIFDDTGNLFEYIPG